MQYKGLSAIQGSLIVAEGVHNPVYGEIVDIDPYKKTGRVVRIHGDKVVIQVFEGTHNMSLENTKTRFTGKPLQLGLSPDILGRVFDGLGRPIDSLGPIIGELARDINGSAINPVAREYPRSFIQTGISAIDGLITLIRGQKLPIFSGDGLPHNRIAAQILRQSALGGSNTDIELSSFSHKHSESNPLESRSYEREPFAIVFGAMGVQQDTAEYFRNVLTEAAGMDRVSMFINIAKDPVVERIATPRAALTAAEYLAYDLGMHVLVILTDMTAYAEALRELSSSQGEIPSRKGYPGYLYSELSSIFERAGILRGKQGSITQIPILSMPGDDITHPIPDLTGFITEGQIVLDRGLFQKGIYPPIRVLPSLSRLMKDGIGEGYTRADHPDLANQLFASYARVEEVRALARVIGEEELNETDQKFMKYGEAFENQFLNQPEYDNRSVTETLDLAWELLEILPKSQLTRIRAEVLEKYGSR